MKLLTKKTLLVAVAGACALSFTAFRTYNLNPRWPLIGGFHYIADLNTTSFPPSSVWDANAQYALSDWRDIGATGFSPGFRRSTASGFNNTDGLNTWMWSNQPTQGWLAVTYYRYNAPDMLEADIVFNSRTDYPWTLGLTDPCKDHPYAPYDFRGVARHETGHAIGLDHENVWLSQMNSIYERGTSIGHTGASGELPHADDKWGCRFLYYSGSPTTFNNLMATCWRPNGGQAARIPFSGTVTPGQPITVPVYIENQTNGPVNAVPTRVGVYLSANDVISTGDTRIADIGFTGSWGAYAEQYYTLNVTVPAGTAPGVWHVGVIVDWSNNLAERYEGDNAARLGTITVLPAPKANLVIDPITLSKSNPERGEVVTLTTRVRNTGAATSPATVTYFYVDATNGPFDLYRASFLHVETTPAIPANGSALINVPVAMPDDVIGGRNYYVRGFADFFEVVDESNENDNERQLGITIQWEQTPGYLIGRDIPTLHPYGTDSITLSVKSNNQPIPPNTWYFFAWTASGTTPGIPIPPFGVLPLNYDGLTDIGFALEGATFHGSRGPVSSTASTFTMDGGDWLAPLSGRHTHFAAIFVDMSTGGIVGICPMPLVVLVQ